MLPIVYKASMTFRSLQNVFKGLLGPQRASAPYSTIATKIFFSVLKKVCYPGVQITVGPGGVKKVQIFFALQMMMIDDRFLKAVTVIWV